MMNFSEISFWQQNYGLLPLRLRGVSEEKFLMLNGGYGDFCLQTVEEGNVDLYKQYSWSSNTKNYLVVRKNDVRIVNWLESQDEFVLKSSIESNLGKFFKYLLSKSYKTQNDVVPFVIDIFKQLRNETTEKKDPRNALSLLFQLLISIENKDLSNIADKFIDFDKAQLPVNFNYYRERLLTGVKSIQPDLDLILRHASGALFQEAHKEVLYFDLQRDLFSGISNRLATKNDTYTSIHYTPPYVARTIVENALKDVDLSKQTLRVLDPSCGSSEFLIEVLKQLKFLDYRGEITIVGFDSSVSAIETSKFLLHYENQTQWNGSIKLQIGHVEDSLAEDWGELNDIILMNPPFVSWEQLKNKHSRDLLKEILAESYIKGKPNQASAFFRKATQSLNLDGVLGCVLPSSLLTFDSYKKLRNEVEESLDLKLLAKLGNFVFEDALTDVSLFVGKRPHANTYPKVIWTKNERGIAPTALREFRKLQANNENAKIELDFNIYNPKVFPFLKESWKIVSSAEDDFLRRLEVYVIDRRLTRLSNIFSVNQGIRQGNRDAFKIGKEQYFQIANKNLFRPVIDNTTIKNGTLSDSLYIWYPYDKNGMMFNEESQLAEIDFFMQTLKPLEAELKNRAGIKEWWGHSRPRNWQFENKIKLVSTEFGNSNSFAFDKTGNFVVERGNAWIPKKNFEMEDYYFYLSVLSSSTFDNLLRVYSKQLAGGKWYDLGAKYTKDIPIPDVFEIDKSVSNYLKLVQLGKDLENGISSAQYSINEEVKLFYPQM